MTTKRRPSTKDHDLLIRIDERQEAHTAILQSILEEAKKTNGRVKALEQVVPLTDNRIKEVEAYGPEIDKLKNFTATVKGAWRSAALIGSTVGALIAFLGGALFK
jgi:transcription elongation factor